MFVLLLLLAALLLAGFVVYGAVPAGLYASLGFLLVAWLAFTAIVQVFSLVRSRERRLRGEPQEVAPAPPAAPSPPAAETGATESAVVQFLARLQEKGRLVDFALDDIAAYDDVQVAAAARVVHQGCREVLQSSFDLRPVHGGAEGEEITLAGDYDPRRYRLIGKVPDRPPFRGTLLHRGWRTGRVALPRVVGGGETAREVVAPAEVEVA